MQHRISIEGDLNAAVIRRSIREGGDDFVFFNGVWRSTHAEVFKGGKKIFCGNVLHLRLLLPYQLEPELSTRLFARLQVSKMMSSSQGRTKTIFSLPIMTPDGTSYICTTVHLYHRWSRWLSITIFPLHAVFHMYKASSFEHAHTN